MLFPLSRSSVIALTRQGCLLSKLLRVAMSDSCDSDALLSKPAWIGIAAGAAVAILIGSFLLRKCLNSSDGSDLAVLSALGRQRGGSSVASGSMPDKSSYQDDASSYGGSMHSSSVPRSRGWRDFSFKPAFDSSSYPPQQPAFAQSTDPFADPPLVAQPQYSSFGNNDTGYSSSSGTGYLNNSSHGNSSNPAAAGLASGMFGQSPSSGTPSKSPYFSRFSGSRTSRRPGHARQDSGAPLLSSGMRPNQDNTDTASVVSGSSSKSGSSSVNGRRQGTVPDSLAGKSTLGSRAPQSTSVPAITLTRDSKSRDRSINSSFAPTTNQTGSAITGGISGNSSFAASSQKAPTTIYGSSFKPGTSTANSSIFGGKNLPPSGPNSVAGTQYARSQASIYPASTKARSATTGPRTEFDGGSSWQGSQRQGYAPSTIPLGSISGPSTLGGTSIAASRRGPKRAGTAPAESLAGGGSGSSWKGTTIAPSSRI